MNSGIKLIERFEGWNQYEARNWNFEKSRRYVFCLNDDILEASYFIHFLDGLRIKSVIELPTSFGCPLGCRHCASSLIFPPRQLTEDEITAMLRWILGDNSINVSDRFLVSFTGTGEGAFQLPVLRTLCRDVHKGFPNSTFSLATAGFDQGFLEKVDELSLQFPIHWVQVSHLHFDTEQLVQVVPTAERMGFDFTALVSTISRIRNVQTRLNYVVIKNFNDSEEYVTKLIGMLADVRPKVTIRVSALNETEASRRHGIHPTSSAKLHWIRDRFLHEYFDAYVFASARNDNLSCGQLAWCYDTLVIPAAQHLARHETKHSPALCAGDLILGVQGGVCPPGQGQGSCPAREGKRGNSGSSRDISESARRFR